MKTAFAITVALSLALGTLGLPGRADDGDLIFDNDPDIRTNRAGRRSQSDGFEIDGVKQPEGPASKAGAQAAGAERGSAGTQSVNRGSSKPLPANKATAAFEGADPLDADFQSKKGNLSQLSLEKKVEKSVAKSEQRMEKKLAIAEADVELYEQMVRIAGWLSQYCVWNRHWPDLGDQENDAIRQLNDLCPNNPYQSNRIQEAQGWSTDPVYQYYNQTQNQITDASSGYEGDSVEPTTTFGALGPKRIRLQYDPSLTGVQADTWKENPPAEWQAPPGTITAISNSNDLVVIWGAGYDGKPLRVPGQNRIRLFVASVKMQQSERSNY